MHNFLQDMVKFDRYFVGSDRIQKQLADLVDFSTKVASNYPPYNIRKVDENRYVIELAVAGFSKQDIELIFEDGKLIVKGQLKSSDDDIFLFKGISDRAFTRQFALADNVEVQTADLFNGMLKIWLEAIIPDSKKPRKIDIQSDEQADPKAKKQLLTEGNK